MADQNLKINLTAFDKTRAAFSSVRGGLNRVKSSVFSVKGALTGLAAAAGIKKLSSDIDVLAKQSSRLGVTVNQLQTLQFAASQSGTDANELAKGFEKFNKSISEASGGLGTGVKAFEALGISLRNNDGTLKNSDQLLSEVADGFTGIKDPADRVRIAMDLFGRSGAGMVNMLQNGSGSLSKIRDDFNKLTVELTGEQARSVENANDRFDALSRTFSSVAQQLTVVLMPALASIATFFTQVLLRAIAGTIETFKAFANGFINIYNILAERLPFLEKAQEATFGQAFADKLKTIADNYDIVSDATNNLSNNTNIAAEGVERLETAYDKVLAKIKDFSDSSRELKANLGEVALKGFGSLEDGIMSVIEGTKSAKEAFKDMARSIISDLTRIAIRRAIVGPLADLMFASMGSSAASVGSGGTGSGSIGSTGSAPTFHAIGGSVQSGRMSVVGERGPELFLPNSSGTIVPNNKMVGEQGVTVNQTINISTGVAQTVRSEIAQLLPQIQDAAKSAVLDARKRGGSFSTAFGA